MRNTNRPPALRLLADEMVADNFAGGGGASTGLEWATGRSPDLAINHNAKAIAMHQANHPATKHFCEDVFDVNPREVVGSRKLAVAWFSPDCTYFSKARGAKPFRDRDGARKRRGLAGVVIRWAKLSKPRKPRIIIMENVEEFQDWGPLDANGMPDPARAGTSFRRWLAQLRNCGYEVEYRQLVAADYGAPTTRRRLFVIARSDGRPIVWPKPTHGHGLLPRRAAAECIDFSLPVHSIFLTKEQARRAGVKRPLAENTLRRIARGVFRYVIGAADPFIVRTAHGERDANGKKRGRGEHSLRDPLPTQAASNDFAMVAPYLARIGQAGGNGKYVNDLREPATTVTTKAEHLLVAPFLDRYYSEREPYVRGGKSLEQPLPTITTFDHHSLVSAFLARHYGGHENDGAPLQLSLPTVTARDHHALVTSHLLKLRGGLKDHQNSSQSLTEPTPTLTASGWHLAEVRAFLVAYYGTGEQDGQLGLPMHSATGKDRFGLVTVHGEDYAIADICMRMLSPRELFNAQSFPRQYLIDVLCQGKPLTKSDQVELVGNAVPPVMGQVLAQANLSDNPIGVAA